ncbi:MAG: hypothetical protein ACI822_002654, partial [Gammaproteobacteria bacterium]
SLIVLGFKSCNMLTQTIVLDKIEADINIIGI